MAPVAAISRSSTELSDELLVRLARAEGQVRGVRNMVERDRRCVDVLTQLCAVQGALDKVALGLLDERVRSCLDSTAAGGRPTRAEVEELMSLVARTLAR